MDTDDDLMRRSVADPECFVGIFERHHDRIHAHLARRLGGDAADDLAAEVFTRAFRGRHTWSAELGPPIAWLYGISGRVISEHRRAEVRHLRRLARAQGRRPVRGDHIEDLAARLDAEPAARRVLTAIAKLDERERDVLLLVAWEGLSYQDAADALALPIGTVRSRLSRARRRLTPALSDTNRELGVTPGQGLGDIHTVPVRRLR